MIATDVGDDGGDDVVCLKPFQADDRDADGLEECQAAFDLRGQIFGRRGARGLVLRIELRAERAAVARDVQRDGEMVGRPPSLDQSGESISPPAPRSRRRSPTKPNVMFVGSFVTGLDIGVRMAW